MHAAAEETLARRLEETQTALAVTSFLWPASLEKAQLFGLFSLSLSLYAPLSLSPCAPLYASFSRSLS